VTSYQIDLPGARIKIGGIQENLKLVRRVSKGKNLSGGEMGTKLSWHCPQKIGHTNVKYL